MSPRAPLARVPPGGPWVRLTLLRRINARRLFLGDLPLKSAAIAVALLLWASAVQSAPEEVTVQLDGRIPIERPEVPAGYVLRGQLGDVGVRLRGPAGAVAAVGQQQLRATLDLAGVVPGAEAQEAPVRVALADERVRVAEVVPPSVSVRLERLTARVLAVQARLANDPPAGYQASPATFRPQEVSVSGPESVVARVAAVLATVRFGDAPVDLAQDVRPEPVDAAGLSVDGVEVDPVSVRVFVPVLSSATTRTVPVLWQLRGAVAPGYWISRVVTDPVVVTVSGERAAVAGLDRVETAPISVSGLSGGRAFVATLQLPEGISLIGATEAQVTVTVVALVGTRPFPFVAVQPLNVASALTAEVDPTTVDVVLAGSLPALNALSGGQVAATVDAAGRGPGVHSLEVVVQAPSGTAVESVQPARVTVTISPARPSPTP